MELIINIPKELYEKSKSKYDALDGVDAMEAIKKGTPYQKGYGDLIAWHRCDKRKCKKPSLWWKCERCGGLIPYTEDYCKWCETWCGAKMVET